MLLPANTGSRDGYSDVAMEPNAVVIKVRDARGRTLASTSGVQPGLPPALSGYDLGTATPLSGREGDAMTVLALAPGASTVETTRLISPSGPVWLSVREVR